MPLLLDQRDPLPGKVLKRTFVVGARIGSGSVYEVYEARQLSVENRKVAVKVVKKALCRDSDADARVHLQHHAFERRVLGGLRSTCFAVLLDAGSVLDGEVERPYLITEYLPGKQLSEVLSASGPLGPDQALMMFLILAEGLDELHSCGVAYRDLSPANVILQYGSSGQVVPRLFDFSHASAFSGALPKDQRNRTWILAGTPPFAAPELTSGQGDARSDVYSLASLLFISLCGVPPVAGAVGTWREYVTALRANPSLPHRSLASRGVAWGSVLDPVLSIALRFQPRERYVSVSDFVLALGQAVAVNLDMVKPGPDRSGLFARLLRGMKGSAPPS